MLRKFEVKNFRNFKETVSIDFTNVHDYRYNEYCVKNNLINSMIIYGKNAEGKSNLGVALFDIYNDITMRNSYLYRSEQHMYKNANASEEELVEFYYSFQLGEAIVDYRYKKRDVCDVVFEELAIDGKTIFSYDLIEKKFDISNVSEINATKLDWSEFFNTSEQSDMESASLTALRYIIYNTIQPEQSIINKLTHFIKGMRFSHTTAGRFPVYLFEKYFDTPDDVVKFEKFLNDYGVNCKLKLLSEVDGHKELYFDYEKPLRFGSNLSSGTAVLVNFYFQYIVRGKPSFIYMDEFDAFYHYELSEKIIHLLEREFNCQIILTTHNTNLLSNSIMRPDCFMILNNGKLTPICEATTRELKQGHNLEKLYINGEFDG